MLREIRYQGAIVRDDHVLLIKHTNHDDGKSYWLVPGGGIEIDESEEACVMREMQEETNLTVSVERLILDEPAESGSIYQRRKTYLCRIVAGEPSPGYEPEEEASSVYGITDVRWFDLRDHTTWDTLALNDAITFPILRSIQAVLGYR